MGFPTKQCALETIDNATLTALSSDAVEQVIAVVIYIYAVGSSSDMRW